jgi:Flp pilus assembly pilin Flp
MTTTLTRGWIYASLWLEDVVARAAGDHDGAETTEYALVAAILGMGLIVGIKFLGSAVVAKFQAIAGSVAGA